jgi:hypothetical protein
MAALSTDESVIHLIEYPNICMMCSVAAAESLPRLGLLQGN